ncbi:putative hydroxymethylpyrimidine transport system permease protein [Lysinibacillus composti]|uniref:ABC transporter permease n=1 Tax=Lysinibacillus composti TaxID=720633 RepID=A0A3N9UIE0_9BACI|nr:ABC transporter permease [Lysinibacillus composti]MBM7608173.1 putative hydroxymethylpyrimidine transport system permease protein [Lysinibacillus composti]RQW75238.1 ABC transporter permease [Lysinibacillus composti]
MKQIKNWFKQYYLFLFFSLALLIGIEGLVRKEVVPNFIIPAPTGVIQTIVENWDSLLVKHLSATMLEFIIGFSIAVVGGVALSISMFFSKTIEQVLYPAIVVSQMIPIIVLSPIFILWFGYSIWSKVAVTVLICFFSIVVSTYDGFKSCDREYIDLLRSMGATKLQIFKKLHIPMCLPSFFTGFKMAIVYALVGATIGEWLGASQGLGYYSRRMSGNLNAEGVFAAITILTIVGILLFALASWLEKRLINKWKIEN